MSQELLENYPIRYIDLTSTVKIADATYGKFCTIKASVYEVKADNHTSITLTDGTGTLIVDFFYDCKAVESVKKDISVVVAGVIIEFGGFKRMTNPLISVLKDEGREVLPIYKNLEIEKDVSRALLQASDLQKAIHGLSTKKALIDARHELKCQQVNNFCLKIGSRDVLGYLDNNDSSNDCGETKIIVSDGFGDMCEELRAAAENDTLIYVVCPLAYKTAKERNSLCSSYFKDCEYLERDFHPNISIECDDDTNCVELSAIRSRERIYRSVVGENYENLKVLKKVKKMDRPFLKKMKKMDRPFLKMHSILVIEDADRFSSLYIDILRERVGGKCFLVSNSNRPEQLSRLEFLTNNYDRHEILLSELKYRRDGDILGNKLAHTELLSLINIPRDIELFIDKC